MKAIGTIISISCKEDNKEEYLRKVDEMIDGGVESKENLIIRMSIEYGKNNNVHVHILINKYIEGKEEIENDQVVIEYIKTQEHFQNSINYLMNNL